MPAGFEVYNDAGKLQVYEGAPALQYVSKGLATTINRMSFSSASALMIDVPTSIPLPIIATRSFGAVAPYYSSNLGNGFIRYVYNTDMPVGATVAYYIFDLASSITPASMGLEIYQDNGTLAFSSNVPAATMIGAISAGSLPLINGRSYAVIVTGYGGYLNQMEQSPEIDPGKFTQDGFQYGGRITLTSSEYKAEQILVDYLSVRQPQWAGPIGNWNIPPKVMLVVDVTALGAIPGEETYILTMQPYGQQITGGSSTGTFPPTTIEKNGSGGNITGYNWGFSNTTNGSWSVSSGQGTATAVATVTGAPVYTGSNLTAADFWCDITVDGTVKRRTGYISYVYNSGVNVSISGLPQEGSGTENYTYFGGIGVSVSGGTPSSYAWSVIESYGAQWSISSGQGTSNVQVLANLVPNGAIAEATIMCSVVVNGVTHTRNGHLTYINTLMGN